MSTEDNLKANIRPSSGTPEKSTPKVTFTDKIYSWATVVEKKLLALYWNPHKIATELCINQEEVFGATCFIYPSLPCAETICLENSCIIVGNIQKISKCSSIWSLFMGALIRGFNSRPSNFLLQIAFTVVVSPEYFLYLCPLFLFINAFFLCDWLFVFFIFLVVLKQKNRYNGKPAFTVDFFCLPAIVDFVFKDF